MSSNRYSTTAQYYLAPHVTRSPNSYNWLHRAQPSLKSEPLIWPSDITHTKETKDPIPFNICLSLSWIKLSTIQTYLALTSILILYHLLCLGYPCGLFTTDFYTKIMHPFLIISMRATYQARPILIDLTTLLLDSMQYGTHYALCQSLIISCLRFTSALKRHQILCSSPGW